MRELAILMQWIFPDIQLWRTQDSSNIWSPPKSDTSAISETRRSIWQSLHFTSHRLLSAEMFTERAEETFVKILIEIFRNVYLKRNVYEKKKQCLSVLWGWPLRYRRNIYRRTVSLHISLDDNLVIKGKEKQWEC